ncbi:MAG TPA: hypothetical protein VHZ09_19915 [Acidobacteriaceae bacterium]|nr:hypothetical protein [Acidobacteriaceae bacterium]
MRGSVAAGSLATLAVFCAFPLLAVPASAQGQVFTVEPEHVEKHYTEFAPTHVRYPDEPLTVLGREELVRFMQAEQGFAMRPLPIATLVLHANGHMDPMGDGYVELLHNKGFSAKAGDRLKVTDIRFHEKSIELDFNGGPEHKHKYLRHITIGVGAAEVPLAQDDGTPPTGARIMLEFEGRIPELNGQQLEALLRPMVDFGVKSQPEAYAESLPPFLRNAIVEHHVLVGMNRDMVRYAKGEPLRKVRETDEAGKPFEIWIYGETPEPVEFVRFVGSYVVRDELARVGEPMLVRASNEMGDYWGNQPALAANEKEIHFGDRTQQDQTQENAPRQAPSLREPGEKLPSDTQANPAGQMGPVNFPKDQQRPGDPGYTPTVPAQQPASGTGTSTGTPSGTTSGTQPTGSSSGQTSGQTNQQQQPNPLDQPQGASR